MLYEWYVVQNNAEPVESFVQRLRLQALKCEFGALRDQMPLCLVVFGITKIQPEERLIRDKNSDLQSALDNIRAAEMTKKQMTNIADGDTSTLQQELYSVR